MNTTRPQEQEHLALDNTVDIRHQMTSQVAYVDEIDGTDSTSVVATWTHTEEMAHRCIEDDRLAR